MGRDERLRAQFKAAGIPIIGQRRAPRVALGYPAGGSVHFVFMQSMFALQRYELVKDSSTRLLQHLFPQQGFFIEDNRNSIVDRFLRETQDDWLVMIDSDIAFPPQIIEMLVAAAGPDRKVLGASVPLGIVERDGRPEPLPSCALRMTDEPGVWAYLEAHEISTDGTEVHGLAMPVFMVHREVLEAIADREGRSWFLRKAVPKLNDPISREAWMGDGPVRDRAYINQGEDLAFCARAIDAGYKLWCCRMPGLRHFKTEPQSHDFDDSLQAAPTAAEPMEATR